MATVSVDVACLRKLHDVRRRRKKRKEEYLLVIIYKL